MTTDTWSLTGEKGEKTALPEAVFGAKVDKRLLAMAVRVHAGNGRRANAKTKTRGEIAKTTAKMYRQKGTGRARHGSYSAPIFVGGGIAHGPDGLQNYSLEMPKKMRRLALIGALTDKATGKKVTVVTGADKATGKTKEIVDLQNKPGWRGKTLVVGTEKQMAWARGWKNVAGVVVRAVKQVDAYTVLANKQLVLTAEAVKEMAKAYVN